MSRSCSVCLHPRRNEVEALLRQGLSIRHSATEIGVGAAALHRHWRRHVANRDTISAADPAMGETRRRFLGDQRTRPTQCRHVTSLAVHTCRWPSILLVREMLRAPWPLRGLLVR